MKKIIALIIAAVLMLGFAACSKEEEKFVIGITIYAPMNYKDEKGELVGFDTEFAKEACSRLGLAPEFVVIDWNTKEMELNSGNIDCIWNGFTVNDERRKQIDFTDSYLENKQVIVIRAEDAGKYDSVESLAGAALVAEVSSAGEGAIEDEEGPLCNNPYTPVAKQSDALLEVKSKTAEAAVIDYTMAMAMVGEGTDYSDLMIMDTEPLLDEEYAIGFKIGSDYVEKFNKVIAEMIADGSLKKIAEKYGLEGQLIG